MKKRSTMSSGLLKPSGKTFSQKTGKTPSKSTFLRSNTGQSQSNFKQGVRSAPRTKFTPTKGNASSSTDAGQAARPVSGSSSERASSRQSPSRSSVGGNASTQEAAHSASDRRYAFGREAEREGWGQQLSEGDVVDQLPAGAAGAIPIVSGGETYYRYDGIYFREVRDDSGTHYVISDRIY